MPFLYVQLANFDVREAQPSESDWAELREAQAATQKLVHTAMVTAIDIGDETNIHPPNKQEVGRRLALAAEATVYGRDVVWQGPTFSGMKIDGRRAMLTFDHAEGLSAKGGELRGFAVAGEDRKFVWAKATIVGTQVCVESDAVSKIVAVRYNWAKNPDGNLVNGSGLPAFPFRTDSWPGVSGE
jgi:sialate O-acetylesterase